MITKESNILLVLAQEPWKKFTFTEIKNLSKKKSKSYVASTLNKFIEESIINIESVSRIHLYSLNISSPRTRSIAGFVLENEGWNNQHIPYKDINRIMQKIPTEDYVFIITGSYAKNKQTKNSDVDVVIIVDDSFNTRKVYAELSHTCELNIPPIHLYVFNNSEFIEMLTNKEANYGKEIVKNNIILYGGQIYLQLLEEAIQNGLTNKLVY